MLVVGDGRRRGHGLDPRPVYHYDGRKAPDCYTVPAALRDELTAVQGEFPLFNYWGPTASLTSTRWIAGAARHVADTRDPDLSFIYVPHLDYDLQRFGPDGPEAVRAAREADAALGPLLDDLRERGTTVVALSEYGISPVSRPVDINRALRREGLLSVYSQRGMEYLDPYTSRAFAVADHQAAHVYVADPADIPRVRDVLKCLDGVDEVWDRTQQADYGIDHPNAGELVAVSNPTPGSRTTTGSTTCAPPTSRAASRSTASPATTRPSCSSTPPIRRPRRRRPSRC